MSDEIRTENHIDDSEEKEMNQEAKGVIRWKLMKHKGYMNALPRKKLLADLQRLIDPEITDREMRLIASQTKGVLSCERGYYIARDDWEGKEDCEHAKEYMKKKIFPLWDRIQKIEKDYPEFYDEETQRRLF